MTVPLTPVSLIGTASYLPPTVVDNGFFGGEREGAMFKGAKLRHHIGAGDSATDMIVAATEKLAARSGVDPRTDIGLILTNVSLPDQPFTGCGAAVARRLGCSPAMIVDVHNAGCVSFVYMMKLAQALMTTSGARTALICNAQTAAGRIFAHAGNQERPQSAVPGDGCGVGLLVARDEAPVEGLALRAVTARAYGEYADDMVLRSDDGGAYWEPRATPMHIDFTEARVAAIVARGNQLVPAIVREACGDAGLAVGDINLLVTNQPNPVFLRNWREALRLPASAHVDTFAEHGNLFGAGIPIALERAAELGKLRPGANVVLAGFSHAGDYAAAAVMQWQAR